MWCLPTRGHSQYHKVQPLLFVDHDVKLHSFLVHGVYWDTSLACASFLVHSFAHTSFLVHGVCWDMEALHAPHGAESAALTLARKLGYITGIMKCFDCRGCACDVVELVGLWTFHNNCVASGLSQQFSLKPGRLWVLDINRDCQWPCTAPGLVVLTYLDKEDGRTKGVLLGCLMPSVWICG